MADIPKSIPQNSYLWDSADVSWEKGKAGLEGALPHGNGPDKHQIPRVKSLEIYGEKGHAKTVIGLVFKQKCKAGQAAVRQPSGYTSRSPAGSKCIVRYPSKVV